MGCTSSNAAQRSRQLPTEERQKFYKSKDPGVRISGRFYDGDQPVAEVVELPDWVTSIKSGVTQASISDQLYQLEEFFMGGVLTKEEYEDAKERVMNPPDKKKNTRAKSIRNIFSLPKDEHERQEMADKLAVDLKAVNEALTELEKEEEEEEVKISPGRGEEKSMKQETSGPRVSTSRKSKSKSSDRKSRNSESRKSSNASSQQAEKHEEDVESASSSLELSDDEMSHPLIRHFAAQLDKAQTRPKLRLSRKSVRDIDDKKLEDLVNKLPESPCSDPKRASARSRKNSKAETPRHSSVKPKRSSETVNRSKTEGGIGVKAEPGTEREKTARPKMGSEAKNKSRTTTEAKAKAKSDSNTETGTMPETRRKGSVAAISQTEVVNSKTSSSSTSKRSSKSTSKSKSRTPNEENKDVTENHQDVSLISNQSKGRRSDSKSSDASKTKDRRPDSKRSDASKTEKRRSNSKKSDASKTEEHRSNSKRKEVKVPGAKPSQADRPMKAKQRTSKKISTAKIPRSPESTTSMDKRQGASKETQKLRKSRTSGGGSRRDTKKSTKDALAKPKRLASASAPASSQISEDGEPQPANDKSGIPKADDSKSKAEAAGSLATFLSEAYHSAKVSERG